MIRKKEVQDKANAWGVKPETVEKDYVLGHVLAGINQHLGAQLIFKGGTCLRKCYFPSYRFSEDLDFSSRESDFILESQVIKQILSDVSAHTGILFEPVIIELIRHKDIKKGYRIRIKYWGPNHDKNEPPPPPDRWMTFIKLEVSTEELILLTPVQKSLFHPYSDLLLSESPLYCYVLDEVIVEKLRSLVQRAYTAPRDYYDLYILTLDFASGDWQRIKPYFLEKMLHKGIECTGPEQLVEPGSIERVRKAWSASLTHQLDQKEDISAGEIIAVVRQNILENL